MKPRIMNHKEFNECYESIKKEYGHMKPGNDMRIRLIGAIEGYAGSTYALTGEQLRKIFDLGFADGSEEA